MKLSGCCCALMIPGKEIITDLERLITNSEKTVNTKGYL